MGRLLCPHCWQEVTTKNWLRGQVHAVYDDKEKADDELDYEDEELVELVGILPPSDAGKSTGTLPKHKI